MILLYNILVVDDEENIRKIVKKYALFEGHTVVEAQDGLDAINKCREEKFDIIIMDIMMPELDGFSLCKELRKNNDIPIIMLSARGEEYDKIHGFEVGIDDYMVKPFSPRELIMRINAIMSRVNVVVKQPENDQVCIDNLVVNFTARSVAIHQKKLEMSPKEYDLLFYMVKNRGIALTREKLITNVWGYDFYGDDRTLDTHIKLLRKSLGSYSKLITTLRGVGYRFESSL